MNKQVTIFDYMYPQIEITKPIRLIELFAGYGSQAMALKRIGANYEHYRVVEFDKYAIASYNAVHGTNFPAIDITTIGGGDLGIVDKDKYCYFLTYSFPCTDISQAGRKAGMEKGSGTRSGLLWEVERLLNECAELGDLPDILMLENVPQVIADENKTAFTGWCNALKKLGYISYTGLLNAKYYGIPQDRLRFFMFSFLDKVSYHFPEPKPECKSMKDLLETHVDDKYYVHTKKAQEVIERLKEKGYLPEKQRNIYSTDGTCMVGRVHDGGYIPDTHNTNHLHIFAI